MRIRFSEAIKVCLLMLFGLLLLFMGIESFVVISEVNNIFIIKFLKLIGLFSFFCFLFFVINKTIKTFIYIPIVIFFCAFLIRLWFILKVDIEPISDFKLLYDTALALSKGDSTVLRNDTYFKLWNYNIFFTIYQAIAIRFIESKFFLQFINVLFSSGIVVLIYYCTQSIFNTKSALFSAVLSIIFPPFIVYTGILTNQTISIFFLLLGLYFFLKDKSLIWVGLFIGIAQVYRPIGIIFLLGFFILFIIQFFEKSNFSLYKLNVLFVKFIKLFLSYQIILIITSIILIKGNFSDHTLYNNASSNYKFLVGLNYESKGGYSQEDSNLLFSTYDTTFKEYSKELIIKRVEDKFKLIELFETKFKIMWSSPDSVFYWANWYNTSLIELTNFMWVNILFLGSFSSFFLINSNNLRSSYLYIPITLGLFIGIYFFIEIQSRYRYELYPLFIILASYGMYEIYNILRKKIRAI